MNLQAFESLKIKKGAFVVMEFVSYPKVPKSKGDVVLMKKTYGVFRLGVTYSKMKVNEGKIVETLKGGEWIKGYENLLLETANGGLNLRVYTTNNHKHRNHTEYYLNGEKVEKQWLIDNGYIKESKGHSNGLFLVKLENVIRIEKNKED